jgi:hypothetical protein
VRKFKTVTAAIMMGGLFSALMAAPAEAAVVHKTGCTISGTSTACWGPDQVRANAAHQLRVCADGGAVMDDTTGVYVAQFSTWRQRCDILSNVYGIYHMSVTGRGRGWIQDS